MDKLNRITMLQHNIHRWNDHKNSLIKTYKTLNPGNLLLHSQMNTKHRNISIPGYTTCLKNTTGEMHDGSAALIKTRIKHKIKGDYLTNTLEIKLETLTGITPVNQITVPPCHSHANIVSSCHSRVTSQNHCHTSLHPALCTRTLFTRDRRPPLAELNV